MHSLERCTLPLDAHEEITLDKNLPTSEREKQGTHQPKLFEVRRKGMRVTQGATIAAMHHACSITVNVAALRDRESANAQITGAI